MARILAAIILLYSTSVEADFKKDKEECETWGKAFYIISTWKPTMKKVEAYDYVISKNTEDKEALSDAVRIIWIAYEMDGTPEEIRKSAIETCMKQRGHTGA